MGVQDSPENMTPATSEESVAVPGPSGDPEKPRHTSYDILIRRAIKAIGAKSGSSKRAITKYILSNHELPKNGASAAITRGLKRMVKNGRIVKNKSGRYKISPRGHQAKIKHRRESLKKALMLRRRKKKRKRNIAKTYSYNCRYKSTNQISTQQSSRKTKKSLKKKKKNQRKLNKKFRRQRTPKLSKGHNLKSKQKNVRKTRRKVRKQKNKKRGMRDLP